MNNQIKEKSYFQVIPVIFETFISAELPDGPSINLALWEQNLKDNIPAVAGLEPSQMLPNSIDPMAGRKQEE